VRRVLATHYRSSHPDPSGPSWLTFLAQTKDSPWSVYLSRCESILLRSHWVLVVMDVCSRRIIGFGIGGECVDGPSLCQMFDSGDCWQSVVKAPEHRSRPTVSFSPLARQPASRRDCGNQIRAVCPDVTSIRRAVDRDNSARIRGLHILLEFDRSSSKARRFPTLLQRSSCAPFAQRHHALFIWAFQFASRATSRRTSVDHSGTLLELPRPAGRPNVP
jgi:hypothetical protein